MTAKTPLHDVHLSHSARMVEFAGWQMPITYGSIRDEVAAVRHKAGLFDVSHMTRLRIGGPQAEAFLQKMVSVDVSAMVPGRVRYAFVLREDGTVQDDVLVSRDEDLFHVCVNAANHTKVCSWLGEHQTAFECEIEDVTKDTAMIALQGPEAAIALSTLTSFELDKLRTYRFAHADLRGETCLLSRTGYTGEDGFEITVPAARGPAVWESLVAQPGVEVCALGARDVLRLEAGMPLFGHELNDELTPVDANLTRHMDLDADFIGRDAIRARLERPSPQRLIGLVMEGKRVPREGYPVLQGGENVGRVVSGTASPTLDQGIATAYIDSGVPKGASDLAVDIRNRVEAAREVPLPFYKTTVRRRLLASNS